ncbi:hypothetical protein GCM10010277_80860 [Streptomyces longisporoflavus]|uniref:hypothetical protein n=1 Tax=Streptomyces longisporoflavus TaxID=28044 RepID=UPI00198B1354|nr:hypothetical protein [Streptomyces longisporoflavus]GGV70160.1 hypothetical protein GCM10010277_80860 [Streptomyces longisporoflavus]
MAEALNGTFQAELIEMQGPRTVVRGVFQLTPETASARNIRVGHIVHLGVAAEGTVSPGLTYSPWGRSFG